MDDGSRLDPVTAACAVVVLHDPSLVAVVRQHLAMLRRC